MSEALAQRIRARRAEDRGIPKCHWCADKAFYNFGGKFLCAPCAHNMLHRCEIDASGEPSAGNAPVASESSPDSPVREAAGAVDLDLTIPEFLRRH